MTYDLTGIFSSIIVFVIIVTGVVIASIAIIKNGRKGCDIGTCSACPYAKNCGKKK
ncbi:MAG: hypothetical protein KBS84_04855 [Treponema sp.]|nr:hypothetical protein [Candidatus Treponema scatequi]